MPSLSKFLRLQDSQRRLALLQEAGAPGRWRQRDQDALRPVGRRQHHVPHHGALRPGAPRPPARRPPARPQVWRCASLFAPQGRRALLSLPFTIDLLCAAPCLPSRSRLSSAAVLPASGVVTPGARPDIHGQCSQTCGLREPPLSCAASLGRDKQGFRPVAQRWSHPHTAELWHIWPCSSGQSSANAR